MENVFLREAKLFPIRKGSQSSLASAIWQDITSKHIQIESEILSLSLSLSLVTNWILIFPRYIRQMHFKRAGRVEISSRLEVSPCGKARKAGECDVAQVIIQTLCTNSRWYVPMLMPIAM